MLVFDGVGKTFSGVAALRDVSFEIQRGEVHAIMGENGAGKSTLMKILCGVYTDYEGEMRLDGERLSLHDPRDALRQGIAIIHQELNLVPELTVAENVFLGREPRTPFGMLDKVRMHRETKALLARLHSSIAPEQPVKALRVGEQQVVEAVKALAPGARLLILDEPTSALSVTEIERLFEMIAVLKQQGVTLVYISHKFEEIFRIADRITVLRDGAFIATRDAAKTDTAELIRLMVGRPLEDLFGGENLPPVAAAAEALCVEQLCLAGETQPGRSTDGGGDGRGGTSRSLQDISFTLHRGEIVGVAGLMGAGRTELLETLFGVHAPGRVKGRILLGSRERRFNCPGDAICAGLAFVTEDRKGQSLIPGQPVRENMTLAALGRFLTPAGFLRHRDEEAAVDQSIHDLHIKTPNSAALVETLSGGNQQKVALAKCLLTQPAILLLDEPTRGIDVGAKAEIYALIRRLAAEGTAVLLASSELPEILGMCDRVLVLCEGRLTANLPRPEATQERILDAATTKAQRQDMIAAA